MEIQSRSKNQNEQKILPPLFVTQRQRVNRVLIKTMSILRATQNVSTNVKLFEKLETRQNI